MTLNVNGFRKNASDEENVPDKIRLDYMRKIKKLIDKVVINKNDIIILQEIPHNLKKNGKRYWFDDALYNSFNEMFREYEILRPKHLINSLHCTVAICKKESWGQLPKDVLQYDTGYRYGNKFVELQCGDVTLLGVHMPVNNDMWDDFLIPALIDAPYTYVVGDFNANEKRGPMSDKPKKIRECGYNNLISSNIITFYSKKRETSIDNIYINSKITLKNVAVKVVDTNLTDHALCILEYEYLS